MWNALFNQKFQQFETLMATVNVGIFIHSRGNFRYINPAAEEILGYSNNEIFSLSFQDIIHPDYLETVQQRAMARHRGEDVPPRYTIQIVRKDGNIRWVEIDNNIFTYEGEPAILVTANDITHLKEVEHQLRISEERFRTLTEVSPVGILIAQGQQYVYANPTIEQMTGYTIEEVCRLESLWDIIHPDHRELVKQRSIARLRGEDTPNRYEILFMTKDGKGRWADLLSYLITFDGTPSILANVIDITERKQQEAARQAMEEQLFEAQREALRQLATPLMPLADHILAMPLIGNIDTERAQLITNALLHGIAAHDAHTIILDMTGSMLLENPVAELLLQATHAARLLGARIILTGISPHLAQMLIHVDIDLTEVVTLATLQQGIAYALKTDNGGRI